MMSKRRRDEDDQESEDDTETPRDPRLLKAKVFERFNLNSMCTDNKISWDFYKEVIDIEEKVSWLSCPAPQVFDISILTAWRKIGQKRDVDVLNTYGTKALQDQLLATRESVKDWDKAFQLSARSRSNAFESIRYAFFMNRAALKIANLDAITQFHLTNPKTKSGRTVVGELELFYFADVCAGPGGFSEYVLWRKRWESKGFGFTLRNCNCDFSLESFLAGTPESFEVNYGANGDGNVLDPVNVESFVNYVLENTEGKGVHLMMADGGIEVEDKRKQEEACKGLYLAQFLVALGIVREGGNFVCKLFDLTTTFSIGLIYLMYASFEEVAIHKPLSSRPANPERYLICKYKNRRQYTDSIYKYLAKCHEMLWNYNKNQKAGVAPLDVIEVVPLAILVKDCNFLKYIKASNDALAKSQILALQKMAIYFNDQSMYEIRQKECRQACLEYWSIPDVSRRTFIPDEDFSDTPTKRFNEIRKDYNIRLLNNVPKTFSSKKIGEIFKSPFDWRFVVLSSGPLRLFRTFFYGMGGDWVMRYEENVWRPLQFNISLPKDTCVYAELVSEVSADSTQNGAALHIIDGFILGGLDIRNLHYTQRHEWCIKFAKAMNKPGTRGAVPIRAKALTRLEHISSVFEKITTPELPEGAPVETGIKGRLYPVEGPIVHGKYFKPTGLLFLKITKDPWMMAYSREAGRKYWFNLQTRESSFDCPETAIADFKYTTENTMIWQWDKDTQIDIINTLIDNPAMELSNKVHPKQLVDHVANFLAHVIPPPKKVIPPLQQIEKKPEHDETEP